MNTEDKNDHALRLLSEDGASLYASPAAVLAQTELSSDEKIRILESWRFDEERIAVAQSEGMSGDPTRLREVLSALATLGR